MNVFSPFLVVYVTVTPPPLVSNFVTAAIGIANCKPFDTKTMNGLTCWRPSNFTPHQIYTAPPRSQPTSLSVDSVPDASRILADRSAGSLLGVVRAAEGNTACTGGETASAFIVGEGTFSAVAALTFFHSTTLSLPVAFNVR